MSLLRKRPPESLDGIYEMPETARYIYISTPWEHPYKPFPRMLLRWIQQGLSSPGLVDVPPKDLLIGFEDLISLRVISFLRSIGVTRQRITAASNFLRKETGHPRPFATKRLWTEAFDMFSEIDGFILAASRGGQIPFLQLLRQEIVDVHGLTFGSAGIADSWSPREYIILRPNIQSGNPCIANTGIPTRAIWGLYQGGDSIGFISEMYEIEEQQALNALKWESELRNIDFIRSTKAA